MPLSHCYTLLIAGPETHIQKCKNTLTAARNQYLRDGTWAHWQSAAMASFTLLFPLASPLLLPLSLLGAQTRLLSSYLAVLMMAFFTLLTSPPVFLTLLPSGWWVLPPGARVRLRRLLLHPYLVRRLRQFWRIFFPFLPSHFPIFLHLSSSASRSRFSSLTFFHPPLPTRSSRFTSLLSSSPLSSGVASVLCHVLS